MNGNPPSPVRLARSQHPRLFRILWWTLLSKKPDDHTTSATDLLRRLRGVKIRLQEETPGTRFIAALASQSESCWLLGRRLGNRFRNYFGTLAAYLHRRLCGDVDIRVFLVLANANHHDRKLCTAADTITRCCTRNEIAWRRRIQKQQT